MEIKIRGIQERIHDFFEIEVPITYNEAMSEASLCLECGTPFCHGACPTSDSIPDWIYDLRKNNIRDAYKKIIETNNFPEITGRVCDSPCESACVIELYNKAVSIKALEKYVADEAWKMGLVVPEKPRYKKSETIAVVGSGPAGLACAQQLARYGFRVDVYERRSRLGGMLRLIPEFRLPNKIVERRISQIKAEGVNFVLDNYIGIDYSWESLLGNYDAVVMTIGCEVPRDLPVIGRELQGVMFVSDLLENTEKICSTFSERFDHEDPIKGSNVVVIGGKTTGWIGVLKRRMAKSIIVQNILPRPPERHNILLTWPRSPNRLDFSPYYEEGVTREWNSTLKEFIGNAGRLTAVKNARVEWKNDGERWVMNEVLGSEYTVEADIAILSLGFLHTNHACFKELGVQCDSYGNIAARTVGDTAYMTNISGLFSAGDARRGQSLVVWAIEEGRKCASAVAGYLGEAG